MQRAIGLLSRSPLNICLRRGGRHFSKNLSIKERFPNIYPLPPVKTDNAHLRYYLPLNPYEKLTLNRDIIQELKPVPWSKRIDLIDEPLSISTMYMEGVTRTRNTGNLFLLTRRDPNTQERVRHLLKRFDRSNRENVSRELVSYPIGKLLGQA